MHCMRTGSGLEAVSLCSHIAQSTWPLVRKLGKSTISHDTHQYFDKSLVRFCVLTQILVQLVEVEPK